MTMTRLHYIYSHTARLLLALTVLLGFSACFERELEREDNYQNVKQAPSIADNEVLRFRTFKVEGQDRFLIFGTSNEVSLEGSAQLPFLLNVDGQNEAATIDLAGSNYRYQSRQDSLHFEGALLRSTSLQTAQVVGVDCLLRRVDIEGTRDRYTLRLVGISLPTGARISVEQRQPWLEHSLGLSLEQVFDLSYYRS